MMESKSEVLWEHTIHSNRSKRYTPLILGLSNLLLRFQSRFQSLSLTDPLVSLSLDRVSFEYTGTEK